MYHNFFSGLRSDWCAAYHIWITDICSTIFLETKKAAYRGTSAYLEKNFQKGIDNTLDKWYNAYG